LNDEINKLIRERARWDKRVAELGGTSQASAKEIGAAKKGEYYYFGQAKNLPGVKELLEQREKKIQPPKL